MQHTVRPRARASNFRPCRPASLAVLAAVTLLLAACGKTEQAPTPTPVPPEATVTATSAALAPTVPANAAVASPAASPAAEPTVGQIADRIAAAWGSVTTYRATTDSRRLAAGATPSPAAASVQDGTIDEVILPGRRHLTQLQRGQAVAEFLVVHGKVWARGPRIPLATPATDPTGWVAIDPSDPAMGSYAGLAGTPRAPYAGLSAAERARIAHPAGTIQVGTRACAAYRVADTTQTGEKIEITIAIDAAGLPCSIETRVGANDTITTWEYNLDLTIAPPTGS